MEKKTLFTKLHTLLQSMICIIAAGVLSAGMVANCYYLRRICKAPFQSIYAVSLVFLVLSFLVFFISSHDEESELKPLVRESLSGYFFFAAFVFITIILRG